LNRVKDGADTVRAASIFYFGLFTIGNVKQFLKMQNLSVGL